jgi:hypothetical protein
MERVIRAAVVVVLAAAAIAGCSGGTRARSTASGATSSTTAPSNHSQAAPDTFAGAVCSAISRWQGEMVDAANAFSTDSPSLDVPGRRARYLRAFDDQKAITTELRDALETAPGTGTADATAIRAVLVAATDDVQTTIRLNQVDAASHPDSDYEFQAVKEDRLFAGTEKSLSQMLKPLDEQARLHAAPELGGSCGR